MLCVLMEIELVKIKKEFLSLKCNSKQGMSFIVFYYIQVNFQAAHCGNCVLK